ncbi:hypothetical protein ASD73_01950 [Sphingopyxis sp. Root154]|uniref:VOC family protein n=1 Tax=unclassified Sphingopyxis TaxID=2614943 RepID=UPI0006F777B9|nr:MULTISPECIES: VOC family protein [unclassified Sphingopyxis]KQZ76692.1 hypothetical protein ASD73_01950 [Sphingopyxis sp. Root154]
MNKAVSMFGPPHQLGYVVPDMESAIKMFETIYAFDETRRFDFNAPEVYVHGKLFPMHLDIFHGVQGDLEYELIQPLSDGPHKWFLDQVGGGFHHIGYNVDAYEPCAELLTQAGMSILMTADMDVFVPGGMKPDHHVRGAYFEQPGLGNMLIEVVERVSYG